MDRHSIAPRSSAVYSSNVETRDSSSSISANFLLVHVGDGAKVFTELQKLGVITRPMGGYQLGEWIRISIGTPKQNEHCLEALKVVLGL